MGEILHIFRKDARHLWPQIVLMLALVVAHAIYAVRSSAVYLPETARDNGIASLLALLLPLCIWFLIAMLVFQEALPGDRQFWLTRPYHRAKLLAAKLLFFLLFLNIPLFLSDCSILAAQNFPVIGVLPDLLLRQLPLTILFILPAFALATLTQGLAQFALAWFLLLLGFVVEAMIASAFTRAANGVVAFGLGGMWPDLVALLALTTFLITWQYARRQTVAGRIVLASVAFVFWPLITGFWPHSMPARKPEHPDTLKYQIHYDLSRSPNGTASSYSSPPAGWILARIPLRVDGLPPNTLLRGGGTVTIEVGGAPWPAPGWKLGSSIERIRNEYWQSVSLDTSKSSRLRQQPANLQTSIHFEIVTDEIQTRVPVTQRSFFMPGAGLCHTYDQFERIQFACRAGLEPNVETAVRIEPGSPDAIIATFQQRSLPLGLSPTTDLGAGTISNLPPNPQFAFIPRRRIAVFDREIDLHDVRLANYILAPVR